MAARSARRAAAQENRWKDKIFLNDFFRFMRYSMITESEAGRRPLFYESGKRIKGGMKPCDALRRKLEAGYEQCNS